MAVASAVVLGMAFGTVLAVTLAVLYAGLLALRVGAATRRRETDLVRREARTNLAARVASGGARFGLRAIRSSETKAARTLAITRPARGWDADAMARAAMIASDWRR